MKMEKFEHQMRIDEFEFRRSKDDSLARSRRYPEIVKWDIDKNDNEFCYTLLWYKRDSEGWYIEFVGDRPLTVENREALWKMMEYGQAVMDAEFKLWS